MTLDDWRDGNACTTRLLRAFLAGAYTGQDSPLSARNGRICVSSCMYRSRIRRKFHAAEGATWPPGKKREESHHSEGRLNQAWKT